MAAALTGLAGCASAGAADATRAAREFVDAVAAQRVDAACALVAPRAAPDCASGVSELADLGQVGSAEVWGDEARAETPTSVLFLHQFADGWRVTGAGCTGDGQSPYECVVGGP
ncbi:hypothetical protein ACFQV2_25250 [Actinokineospora soli]|uniref:Lipoprotein n=1 Tax=Actinokineospora soli TaxID=1048753 RepID=A0ABW2TTG8_9PSEU